ncbi:MULTISPECIES: hypothetical protein [Bacillus cereus group]|uniref:Uncharacterized protein n=1 Tax=Bacillus cereus TaxID=1396 RepID=A0A9W7QE19_BACCE|nr:hypothetical protein [Bacillus cereus]KAB2393350.1 hypothetical protein F8172_17495 [Bacillus cereus]KAB2410726.1 hypothetical protein F8170_01240 [Bacillus cereus]KAB2430903.1 hypothetical protein F8168_06575 [Bacillus cereus]
MNDFNNYFFDNGNPNRHYPPFPLKDNVNIPSMPLPKDNVNIPPVYLPNDCHHPKPDWHYPKKDCHYPKPDCHHPKKDCHYPKPDCHHPKKDCHQPDICQYIPGYYKWIPPHWECCECCSDKKKKGYY